MLRINLLPPYIYDKQKKVKLAVLWAAIVAAALCVFLLWFVQLNTQLGAQKAEESTATDFKGQYDKVESDINTEKKLRADIEARQTFIANAQKYNDAWPAAFETMRDVTANDILLKSMAFDKSRKVVSFTGFAKDEETIVKWWMYLRNNYAGPDAALPFDNVSFSLPPHPYAPQAAAGRGGGGKGGFDGPMSGGMGPPSLVASSGGGFGGPNSGGGKRGGGAGGNDAAVGPGIIEGRPGINFTASIVLKKPLSDGIPTPVWPGGGAPAASPGGFGSGGGGAPTSGGGPAAAGRE